jgi:riboflavin kinase / FMN adenylyltransferase
MNVLVGIDGLKRLPAGAVVSIGNFDGMHLGHRKILDTMKSLRDGTSAAKLAVVTFEPHPLTVLRPQIAPPRLTPSAMKQTLLADAGVDELVILPPTRQVLDLTAKQFWAILRDDVKPSHLVEGSSFNFGKNRGGTIDTLRTWSTADNVDLHVIDAVETPLLDLQIVQASSSIIRWLLSWGRVRDAAICLGRPFTLVGGVVHGHGRGRKLGVPTANLDCGEQMIPADGVYAARCDIDGRTFAVALSIGTTPTFGQGNRQVEAHLIGFTGNLYERTIEIQMLDWLREQVKFAGIDALKEQLSRDFCEVERRVGMNAARAIARSAASG